MSIWRPQQAIQVKAIGLVWRRGLLLATEISNDDGTIKGVRPLGGRVEFGETWQEALVREFEEELGITVEIAGSLMVFENIYVHHGARGHEVVFAADVTIPEDVYVDDAPITFVEDNGETCLARWFDVSALDQGGLELYPTGLKQQIELRLQNGS